MEFTNTTEITEEDDTKSLITHTNNTTNSYYGAGVAAVKVVEYMLSSMSSELLRKFPDNSAFDFDYAQSAIWSPLVPHPSHPSSPAIYLQRKLSFEDEDEEQGKENVAGTVVKKFDSCMIGCFNVHRNFKNKKMMKMKMKMKRRRSSYRGFDQLGSNSGKLVVDSASCSPIQIKGWKKVLKAASKQFKKTMKKKDSGSHLKISSNGFSKISY